MKRVLITGADGFVGSHLVREIFSSLEDVEILGIGLKKNPPCVCESFKYTVLDILDKESLKKAISSFRPDWVFHLAAQPSVALSWRDPWTTYTTNVHGQLNLFEIIREEGLEVSIHVACSSEEYGIASPEEMPLAENAPLRPCSHYAVSKVAQEYLALMYKEAFCWRVIITRGFNQAGPGQSEDFVISSFARQIAEIEAGLIPPVIRVGNLQAERDFTDVRDTVRAYRMLMELAKGGSVYNVCSGTGRKISDVLDMMLEFARVDMKVEPDPLRQRPSDIPVFIGDNSLIKEEIGWEPAIPFEKTLLDTIEFWRNRVRAKTQG